ncbi:CHAD domain-containing protein [Bosea sp. 124]|uniref:CHAD domain-containing protein n=1 Tax=Bosea sp. 124 TaxID=2135642 RepID=UPI000D4ABC3E|nr:CHAD domain-containing protein [Bosea sp. 124]PTM42845.1 inorganic triphosphatase YgiF [Bosea sp. 124]
MATIDRPLALAQREGEHGHPGGGWTLRLHLAEEGVRQVLRQMQAAGGKRPGARAIRSIFYDTDGGKLQRKGYRLSIRSQGRRRFQHIETARPGSLWRDAGRWSAEIEDGAPSRGSIQGTPLEDLLGDKALGKLRRVFSVDLRRRNCIFERDGARILALLDTGTIMAGEASEVIAELRLRLLDGPTGALSAFARELGASMHASLTLRSHGERGWRLLQGQRGSADADHHGDIRQGMTTMEAIESICRRGAAALLDDLALLQDGAGHHALHETRIDLRRLRAILSFCKPVLGLEGEGLPERLRELATFLGGARELDVFCDRVLGPLRQDAPDAPGLDAFAEAVERRRGQAHDEVAAYVRSPAMLEFGLGLVEWLGGLTTSEPSSAKQARLRDRPMSAFVNARLQRRLDSFLKLSRDLRNATPDRQHDIRIRAKKLRYAVEAFHPGLDVKSGGKLLAKLRLVQDLLGDLNDCRAGRVLALTYVRGGEANGAASDFAAGFAAGVGTLDPSEALARAAAVCDELASLARRRPGKT